MRNIVVRPARIAVPSGQRATPLGFGWGLELGFAGGHTTTGMPDPGQGSIVADGTVVVGDFVQKSLTQLYHPIMPGDAQFVTFGANNQSGMDVRNGGNVGGFDVKLRITLITTRVPYWDVYRTTYADDAPPYVPIITTGSPAMSPDDWYIEKWFRLDRQTEYEVSYSAVIDMASTGITLPIIGVQGELTSTIAAGQASMGVDVTFWTTNAPAQFTVVAREAYSYTSPFGPISVCKVYLQKASETDPTLNSVSTFWLPKWFNISCQPGTEGDGAEFSNSEQGMWVWNVAEGQYVDINHPATGPGPFDRYDSGPSSFIPLNYVNCGLQLIGYDLADNALIYNRFNDPSFTEAKTACGGVVVYDW